MKISKFKNGELFWIHGFLCRIRFKQINMPSGVIKTRVTAKVLGCDSKNLLEKLRKGVDGL